jgi:undecaprenyl pyrophosphate phosphatase UppP
VLTPVAAHLVTAAVHYLMRCFKTRTLVSFGIYCVVFGLVMVISTTV